MKGKQLLVFLAVLVAQAHVAQAQFGIEFDITKLQSTLELLSVVEEEVTGYSEHVIYPLLANLKDCPDKEEKVTEDLIENIIVAVTACLAGKSEPVTEALNNLEEALKNYRLTSDALNTGDVLEKLLLAKSNANAADGAAISVLTDCYHRLVEEKVAEATPYLTSLTCE